MDKYHFFIFTFYYYYYYIYFVIPTLYTEYSGVEYCFHLKSEYSWIARSKSHPSSSFNRLWFYNFQDRTLIPIYQQRCEIQLYQFFILTIQIHPRDKISLMLRLKVNYCNLKPNKHGNIFRATTPGSSIMLRRNKNCRLEEIYPRKTQPASHSAVSLTGSGSVHHFTAGHQGYAWAHALPTPGTSQAPPAPAELLEPWTWHGMCRKGLAKAELWQNVKILLERLTK